MTAGVTAGPPFDARFAANTASIARVARRLSLPAAVNLASIDVQGRRLRLVVRVPRLPDVIVSVEPNEPGSAAYLRRSDTQVSYRFADGTRVNLANVEPILHGLCAFALRLSWKQYLDLVEPDAPDAPAVLPVLAPHDEPRAWRPFDGQAEIAGPRADVDWGCFLANDRHSRDLYASLRFDVTVTRVVHADAECLNESPMARLIRQPFVVNPWETGRAVDPRSGGNDEPPVVGLTTDLGDLEIIAGTLPRFEALLSHVAQTATTDVVVVSNSCVPNILGEDLDAAVERFRCRCPRPVVYTDQKDESLDRHLSSVVEQLAAQAGEDEGPLPGSVALLGLHDARGRSELAKLLTDAGVPVAGVLIPEVSIERLRSARRAAVVVRPTRSSWGSVCDALAAPFPGRPLALPGPYGVEGSHVWLRGVAHSVQREAQIEAAWIAMWSPLASAWNDIRCEASRHRLGFLLTKGSAGRLLAEGGLAGIPVLDVVLEAGFGVDLGVIGETEVPPAFGSSLLRYREVGDRLRLIPLPTEADLPRALEAGSFDAALSEFFEDDRLTSNGIGRFSMADVEAGPEGALRTAKRLVSRCSIPFLRRLRRSIDYA